MKNNEEKNQLSLDLEKSPETEPEISPEAPSEEATLEWVCHPARKNMRVTVLVTAFLVILIGVVYYATDYSLLFAGLAVLVLFGSLASFYFPTRYKLTGDEIIVKTKMQTLTKKWSQYRTSYPDKNGILLSPFVRPSRLENFRGLYIKFWFNREEVLAFIRDRLARNRPDDEGNR
jgi:hypothetical protein